MTYRRVIPRDLFNEANLLKCYGRLWICLDNAGDHRAELVENLDFGEPFRVVQNDATGGTYLGNVLLCVNGASWHLERPLNSREDWPLYVEDIEGELDPVAVFNSEGELTPEFRSLIK